MAGQVQHKSASLIYHIILGSSNRQTMYEEGEDFYKYRYLLSFYKNAAVLRCTDTAGWIMITKEIIQILNRYGVNIAQISQTVI